MNCSRIVVDERHATSQHGNAFFFHLITKTVRKSCDTNHGTYTPCIIKALLQQRMWCVLENVLRVRGLSKPTQGEHTTNRTRTALTEVVCRKRRHHLAPQGLRASRGYASSSIQPAMQARSHTSCTPSLFTSIIIRVKSECRGNDSRPTTYRCSVREFIGCTGAVAAAVAVTANAAWSCE